MLLVDHGSRRPEAARVAEAVAAALRLREPGWIVEVAHLEIQEPKVDAGIDACVAAGASEVVIHPYFIAPGMHAIRDIESHLDAARTRHAGIPMRVTPPLGFDERIVEVVLERIQLSDVGEG